MHTGVNNESLIDQLELLDAVAVEARVREVLH